MKTIATTALAAILAAASILPAPAPAAAQGRNDIRMVRSLCDRATGRCYSPSSRHWNRGYYGNGHRYYRDAYRGYYGGHYHDNGHYGYYDHHDDHGDEAAAAILGLGAGALLGGALAGGWGGYGAPAYRYGAPAYGGDYGYGYDATDHVRRCAARYRSYDPGSDTFLGYDGYRHRCQY